MRFTLAIVFSWQGIAAVSIAQLENTSGKPPMGPAAPHVVAHTSRIFSTVALSQPPSAAVSRAQRAASSAACSRAASSAACSRAARADIGAALPAARRAFSAAFVRAAREELSEGSAS